MPRKNRTKMKGKEKCVRKRKSPSPKQTRQSEARETLQEARQFCRGRRARAECHSGTNERSVGCEDEMVS